MGHVGCSRAWKNIQKQKQLKQIRSNFNTIVICFGFLVIARNPPEYFRRKCKEMRPFNINKSNYCVVWKNTYQKSIKKKIPKFLTKIPPKSSKNALRSPQRVPKNSKKILNISKNLETTIFCRHQYCSSSVASEPCLTRNQATSLKRNGNAVVLERTTDHSRIARGIQKLENVESKEIRNMEVMKI